MSEPFVAEFASAVARDHFRAVPVDARTVREVIDAADVTEKLGLNDKVENACLIVHGGGRHVVVGARPAVIEAIYQAIEAQPLMVEFAGFDGDPVRIDAFSVSRIMADRAVRDGISVPVTMVYSSAGSGRVSASPDEVNDRLMRAKNEAVAHVPL